MKNEIEYDIKEVIAFVEAAHGEQKYGTLPYIVHPVWVASHFTTPIMITIALLHDVVEDTGVTLLTIERTWGSAVALEVDALTRRPGENYMVYIKRVKEYHRARMVKIADLEANIQSAQYFFPEYKRLVPRYIKALDFLIEGLQTSTDLY